MKFKLLFYFLFFSQIILAQTFTELLPTSEFDDVGFSSIAFSDIDEDSDIDLLIVGLNDSSERTAKLYINDGLGNFEEVMNTPFEEVSIGSIAISDVDGDGDNDILITGENNSSESVAKLYTNDGIGNFEEVLDTPFDGVTRGSIAFSDIDDDSDNDVLIVGLNDSSERTAKLYINDGIGNFEEVMNAPFEGVSRASIAFSDIDGDEDEDVLISGNAFFSISTKLYTNDGTGSFSEVMNTPFEEVQSGSIAFSDVNNDGDNDVVITGRVGANEGITKLYTNDGLGNFEEDLNTTFEGVYESSIAFADVDNDGDSDLLITGETEALVPSTELYINDGSGSFDKVLDSPFDDVTDGAVAFADIDNDGDSDLMITGVNNAVFPTTKLFANELTTSSNNDLEIRYDFNLFPNPLKSSSLFLKYNSARLSEITLKVYTSNGNLLKTQKEFAIIGEQTFLLNLASLVKGNYFIELDDGTNRKTVAFIIQ